MSKRYEVVVLGATGVTGKRVLRYLCSQQETGDWKIGAAGRDAHKVQKLLSEEGLSQRVLALKADAKDASDLANLARSTRLLLNCVGPYRFTGEAVVSACVEAGTDYLDVSGEPEFLEAVELKFGAAAKDKGCFVTSACGFDSVPADIGTIVTQEKFLPGTPSSVESFLSLHSTIGTFRVNFATWESAVHGFASTDQLRAIRQRAKAAHSLPPPKVIGPKLRPPASAAYDSRVGAYVIPFPGSDASVVRRTQRSLAALGGFSPVHFNAHFCISSRWNLLLLAIFSWLLKFLAGYGWGRRLLLAFPGLFSWGVFSKKGPTEEHLTAVSFRMLFIAKGFRSGGSAASGKNPDREVRVQLSGPEPGYVATPIFLVQAALTLLAERRKIEEKLGPGGVFTTGALLGSSSYVKRLREQGKISIEVVSDRAIGE